MKRTLLAVAVMAVLLLSAAPANADIANPSVSDLGGLAWGGFSVPGYGYTDTNVLVAGCAPTQFGAQCAGGFNTVTGTGTMVFNASVLIPYTSGGFNTTHVQIYNNNNTTWNFAYCIGDGFATACTAFTAIAAGTSQTLGFATTLFGDGTLNDVWIVLQNSLPNIVANCTPSPTNNNCHDYGPDFFVNAVPEPGTLMLLGTAMLGLAAFRRKIS